MKWLVGVLLLAGCTGTLPPLRHELEPGQDAYLIFVADGPGGPGELYASAPVGGKIIPVTFSPVAESAPALSPDGTVIVFLRSGGTPADSARRRVWALNLLNGAERRLPLPDSAGTPRAVGWSADGSRIYIRTDASVWTLAAPPRPAQPQEVPVGRRAAADSALGVLLGRPVFAQVVACDSGLCVRDRTGAEQALAPGAHDAAAWGADSVAYFLGDQLEIRPLGPGHVRPLRWSPPPRNPRGLNYFPGTPK